MSFGANLSRKPISNGVGVSPSNRYGLHPFGIEEEFKELNKNCVLRFIDELYKGWNCLGEKKRALSCSDEVRGALTSLLSIDLEDADYDLPECSSVSDLYYAFVYLKVRMPLVFREDISGAFSETRTNLSFYLRAFFVIYYTAGRSLCL